MDQQTYSQLALSTEAPAQQPNVPVYVIDAVAGLASHVGDVVDQMKKVIFYRREPNLNELLTSNLRAQKAADVVQSMLCHREDLGAWPVAHLRAEQFAPATKDTMRLLHHAFGRLGEAAELLAALRQTLRDGVFDETNYVEEMGDGGWYDPIALDVMGLSQECIDTANIAKLKLVRYRKGFSGEAATNRRLVTEKEVIAFVIDVYRAQFAIGNGHDISNAVLKRVEDHFFGPQPDTEE